MRLVHGVHQAVERVCHVPVADIPRLGAAAHHGAIVSFGILYHKCILFGGETRLVTIGVVDGIVRAQLAQQLNDFVFARRRNERGSPCVLLNILAVRLKANQSAMSRLQQRRVSISQVPQHGVERIPQAVNVESEEADFFVVGQFLVVFAKPFSKSGDFFVGPHPCGPTRKGFQNVTGVGAGILKALDIAVDAIAVGPVAFDGDEGKPLFADETLANLPGN